jgi:uncharacterized phage protein gp47/JayE
MSRDVFIPLTETEWRDQYISDCGLAADVVGLPTPEARSSEWFVQGTALAQLMVLGAARMQLIEDNINIYDCDAEQLEAYRAGRGIPQLEPEKATGRIVLKITGTATMVAGTEFTYKSGARRGRVLETEHELTNGAEVEVEALDTGADGNLPGGSEVRFVAPPLNIAPRAYVSAAFELAGGTDTETIDHLRARIIDDFASPAAGGNSAHIIELVRGNDPSLSACYVYPALGGPGTALVVPVVPFDVAGRSITRRPSEAQLQAARAVVQAELPESRDIYILAPTEHLVDFAATCRLPGIATGNGWADATPWPALVGADNGRVSISAVGSDGTSITVTANTTTAPTAALSSIAWWSSVDCRFRTTVVLSSTGSAGAWVLTLETPLVDYSGAPPAVGDYVCPAAKNSVIETAGVVTGYGATWLSMFVSLGPGEAVASSSFRYPHAARYPLISDTAPADFLDLSLFAMQQAHSEMSGSSFSYSPTTTPTIPATVATPPYILVPRHFGIYKA